MTPIAEISRKPQEQFFDVINESMLIRRHMQLFMWLQGDLQKILPHDVLLVAHGDFSKGKIRYDIISAVRESRNTGIFHQDIEDLVTGLFDRWVSHGRTIYSLETTSGVILNNACQCNLHRTLRGMRSIMVQGMRDERASIDVLYIVFRANEHFTDSNCRMLEILLPHIDFATRRISNLTEKPDANEIKKQAGTESSSITARESEILRWVSNGKTNYEIGIILGISPFTVKNHLQRIFRKIDVSNRAHAVSKYEEISRHQHQ